MLEELDYQVEAERSRWDVVFDAVGTEQSLAQAVDMVKPGGRVVIIGIYWDGRVTMPGFAFCMKEVRLIASMVYGSDAHGRDADHAARILNRDLRQKITRAPRAFIFKFQILLRIPVRHRDAPKRSRVVRSVLLRQPIYDGQMTVG